MGDGLFVTPKHSNSSFVMLYMIHEMDIDYLVVSEMINISNFFEFNCMLSIGANL
jgi:hypothetical protein